MPESKQAVHRTGSYLSNSAYRKIKRVLSFRRREYVKLFTDPCWEILVQCYNLWFQKSLSELHADVAATPYFPKWSLHYNPLRFFFLRSGRNPGFDQLHPCLSSKVCLGSGWRRRCYMSVGMETTWLHLWWSSVWTSLGSRGWWKSDSSGNPARQHLSKSCKRLLMRVKNLPLIGKC